METLKRFFQVKKDWFKAFLGVFVCILVLVIALFLHRMRDEWIAKRTKKLIEDEYVNPLVEYEVYYKDGGSAIVKATSVIYGETNDKIYFLGQFNDTLQILPKIMVEDIKEVNNNTIKK